MKYANPPMKIRDRNIKVKWKHQPCFLYIDFAQTSVTSAEHGTGKFAKFMLLCVTKGTNSKLFQTLAQRGFAVELSRSGFLDHELGIISLIYV